MRPVRGLKKFKKDPKFPHLRSDGLTKRHNGGTRAMAMYERRTFDVEAARWTGDNYDEIDALVRKYSPHMDDGFFRVRRDDEGVYAPANYIYDTLQWFCCEDHELDRGRWVVFKVEPDNPEAPGVFHAILTNTEFRRIFKGK